ncbi:hypothetical protein ACFVUS_16045 [Nocardia sp. NPDC058058]|uniref:hypothetical protein n=1 Tax=Nocardia sp. NPDC058058 TaxID=3346317 RepID=UPI0036DD4E2C
MSNIFTDFVRVYAQTGHSIQHSEAEWIAAMLIDFARGDHRSVGSYWVPVWFRVAEDMSYADIQYGSGKSLGMMDFLDQLNAERYRAVWVRHYDEGGDQDVIACHYPDDEGRFCRYGFDEVRVSSAGARPSFAPERDWRRHEDGAWGLTVSGSYRTGNGREDMEIGPCAGLTRSPSPQTESALSTPTTPCYYGDTLAAIDPPWLEALADASPELTLVEFRWQGRVVHRARMEDTEWGREWEHRSADDWDNCLDAEFLRFTGVEDALVPPEVRERDRRDWEAAPWYRGGR